MAGLGECGADGKEEVLEGGAAALTGGGGVGWGGVGWGRAHGRCYSFLCVRHISLPLSHPHSNLCLDIPIASNLFVLVNREWSKNK
jgi:hypothetical protein